jgi:transposase
MSIESLLLSPTSPKNMAVRSSPSALSGRGSVTSIYSSGAQCRQGSIATAGNTHARRALGEGAWAYRDPANVKRHRYPRLENHSAAIQDISNSIQEKDVLRKCS